MRTFACSVCKQMVFFENVRCTKCGASLGYLPEHRLVSALETADDGFVALAPAAGRARYRACRNGVAHAACNWMVAAADDGDLCRSCRLSIVIPNLDEPEALPAWQKLEGAKRRLLYTLHE